MDDKLKEIEDDAINVIWEGMAYYHSQETPLNKFYDYSFAGRRTQTGNYQVPEGARIVQYRKAGMPKVDIIVYEGE